MQRQNVDRRSRRQAGVSLVEVFVALLVLSVGLIALAKLQVDLVRGGGDTRARAAALALAEQKLEDLRTFSQTTSAAMWDVVVEDPTSTMAWSFIEDNKGGRIKSEPIVQAGVQYNLRWTVDDPVIVGPTGDSFYKVVEVTVEWTGGDNRLQQVTLSASIPDTPPSLTQQASTDMVGNLSGPLVAHVPGVQPEVIAIDVGPGLKRETSKPLPTVKKTADSTMVTFDVVTYHTNNNAVARREEFVTISCRCTFDGTGPARTPAKATRVGATLLRDQPGKIVTKTVGIPADTQQPPLCNICCRDHHDFTDGTDNYRYNPEDTSNHAHYLKTNLNSAVTSGNYDEACRLKRVNGVFQVFEDWNLRTLTVLPKADLELGAAKADDYVQAVQKFIDDYARAQTVGGAAPTSLDTSVFTPSAVSINPATSQLLARAIYIDNMPQSLKNRIEEILTDLDPDNDESVRALVPFYEIHLTKLADWSTYPNLNNAMVTSEAIETDSEGLADAEPYSRGFVQPAAEPPGGTATIIASAKSYNTGLTATAPINAKENREHPRTPVSVGNGPKPTTFYSSNVLPTGEVAPDTAHHKDGILEVTVAANTVTRTISGSIKKAKGSGDIDPNAIKLPQADGVNCSPASAVGQVVEAFTCVVEPGESGWQGVIQFSSTAEADYVFCAENNGEDAKGPSQPAVQCTGLPDNKWSPPTPITVNTPLTIYVSTPVP